MLCPEANFRKTKFEVVWYISRANVFKPSFSAIRQHREAMIKPATTLCSFIESFHVANPDVKGPAVPISKTETEHFMTKV